MKPVSTISIALATYNEEENISRCLDAVSTFADEIIVVDGQSQDETVSLVKKYPQAKVISTTNKPIFHINKQMAIDACKSDWILQLDADEVVSSDLKKEIGKILSEKPADIPENGFWLNRKNYFLGSFLTKGGQYPDPTIRLYKNGKGRLPCKNVHEQAEVEGSVGHLKSDLLHFADPSFSRYLLRYNRYTSLLSQEFKDQKVPLNFSSFIDYFIVQPSAWFIKAYFRHRGYVDGFPGFVFAYFSGLRFAVAYVKYWEISKTGKSFDISRDWDKK